ncbi:hypothetical protein FRC07_004459 [Ceratobasidium sp. 392]|nr:hypothetical protein FRC07_004459 [Ceratobasidium sp. 392]
MTRSSNTSKGKGKQPEPQRPRRNQDDDRRSRQTQAAQAALASGKWRSAKSRAHDGEEDEEEMDKADNYADGGGDEEGGMRSDEDNMAGNKDDFDLSKEEFEDDEELEEFEEFKGDNAQARLHALQDTLTQSPLEMRQVKHAIAESHATNRTEAHQRALATNVTPGASSSHVHSTNTLHPVASTSRSIAGPSHSIANSAPRPTNASRPAASGSCLPANTPRLTANGARPSAGSSRPPANEVEPSCRARANEPPPLIGVGAPSFIPYPKHSTEMTIVKIWYGLGAVERKLWQAMEDVVRQALIRSGLNYTKIWHRQDPDVLALLYTILEQRLPGLQNFEDHWATARLVQTRFNHRRGHALQKAREEKEAAIAAELASNNANLDYPGLQHMESVEPEQPATNLDKSKPEQTPPEPAPQPSFAVPTGVYADVTPSSRSARPGTGSTAAAPSSLKKSRGSKPATPPPPSESDTASEPEPVLKLAPKAIALSKAATGSKGQGKDAHAASKALAAGLSAPAPVSVPAPSTSAPSAPAPSPTKAKTPGKAKGKSNARASANASEGVFVTEVPMRDSAVERNGATNAEPEDGPTAERQPKPRRRPKGKPVPLPSPTQNTTDLPTLANGPAPNGDEGGNAPPELAVPQPQPIASNLHLERQPEDLPLAQRRKPRTSTVAATAASEQTAAACKKRPAPQTKGRASKKRKQEQQPPSSLSSVPMEPEPEDNGPHESDDGRRDDEGDEGNGGNGGDGDRE